MYSWLCLQKNQDQVKLLVVFHHREERTLSEKKLLNYERTALWAAHTLVREYARLQIRHQLHITTEMDPCAAHDVLLPAGHTILRPSLKSESGVGIFWGHELLHLRRFFAPDGTIDDLIKVLDRIAHEGTALPEGFELFAREEENSLYPYEKDGKDYMVCARIKSGEK